jgi:hypothetical protein
LRPASALTPCEPVKEGRGIELRRGIAPFLEWCG